MQVGNVVLGLTGGTGLGDGLALAHRRALANTQCSEVRERRLVAVTRHDRHRETVRRNLPGERDLAGRRREHRTRLSERDVDASMLTGCVLVGPDRELAKDGALRRPCPRPGRRTPD